MRPFSGELLIALACERLLGLTVPARAVWLRTLLAEHTRILSHCAFLSYLSQRGRGAVDLVGLREELRGQTMLLSGNRIHPMINRVGGLAADADDHWLRAELSGSRPAPPRPVSRLASMIDSDSVRRADFRRCARSGGPPSSSSASAARPPAPAESISTCAFASPTWRTANWRS